MRVFEVIEKLQRVRNQSAELQIEGTEDMGTVEAVIEQDNGEVFLARTDWTTDVGLDGRPIDSSNMRAL